MAETAKLIIKDKTIEMPLFEGSEAELAIDSSELRAKTGAVTFDDGYGNTGACKSAITFLDGEKGILRYRGYSIDQVADGGTFLDTALLLLKGELQKKADVDAFEKEVVAHSATPASLKAYYEALPADTHPMAAMAAGILALYGFDKTADDFKSFDSHAKQLLGKVPTLAAAWYRRSKGLEAIAPDASLGYTANFLYMMFGKKPEQSLVDALDVLFILHADHEQNCSTSTVRLVGSAHANIYASIAAGVSALWGPRHGGANQEVVEMLQEIEKDGGDVNKALAKAKDKNSGFLLMGFGHRVYKNFDPRAKIIKIHADSVLKELGVKDQLLDIAKGLETAALTDDYFVSRKLYPNVDFYSGLIYRAMGFPTEMFTVLFVLGRLPGWIAQWKEMRDNKAKIGRPRQIYTGSTERAFTKLSDR